MSLLAPLGLLLGLLALPLLGLYFLKIRRRKVTVPSLLLWEELVRAERLARPFDKFRRNILLWLQLLLLLLVTLAFARPAIFGTGSAGRSVVMVLDTSASMAATDERPTRLGRAVRMARAELDSLGPSDEATIVLAGPRAEVVAPFSRDLPALRGALDQVQVAGSRAHLREGVQLALSLARSRPDSEVLIYSDGGHGSLADLPVGEIPVAWRKVGSDAGNAGILAVDLRASPSSELDRQLFVTVQRFGAGTAEATVQVFLKDQLVGLRNATLEDKAESLVFEIPGATAGELRVELDADDDHLPLDDRAFAIVEPVRKRRVGLVGGDRLTARVLSKDPRVDLERIRPDDLTREALDDLDAVVLSEPVSVDLTGVSVAYLRPQAGGPATLGQGIERPEVLGWRRTHPLLRFVTLEGVVISEAFTVEDQGGLAPVADSTAGPLILAGERGSARVVQVAFDPLRTDLPLRVAWPVLVLNTVGWLTERRAGVEHGHVVSAGDPWLRRVPDDVQADQVQVTGPDDFAPRSSLSDRLLRVQDTTRLGIYKVKYGDGRARFAVNLQAAEESDLIPPTSLDVGSAARAGAQPRAATVGGPTEIWRYILLFGLIVLGVEWWVWSRRKA